MFVFFSDIFNLTNQPTKPMMLLPSWETASRPVNQEFPNNSQTPKYHHCFNKCLPLVPIFSEVNPIRNTAFYILNVHFNIILQFTSQTFPLYFSFWLYFQGPVSSSQISLQYSYLMPTLPFSLTLGLHNMTYNINMNMNVCKYYVSEFMSWNFWYCTPAFNTICSLSRVSCSNEGYWKPSQNL
jgi:hypothetical protein